VSLTIVASSVEVIDGDVDFAICRLPPLPFERHDSVVALLELVADHELGGVRHGEEGLHDLRVPARRVRIALAVDR